MNPHELPIANPYPSSSNSKEKPNLPSPNPPSLNGSQEIESHKIKNAPLPTRPPQPTRQKHEPRIIYCVPPKVIHVGRQDFKELVIRLTGLPSDSEPPAGTGDVSPETSLASIERTSPPQSPAPLCVSNKRRRPPPSPSPMGIERFYRGSYDDLMRSLEGDVHMSNYPGFSLPEPMTLTPPPVTLPQLPPIPRYIYSLEKQPQLPENIFSPVPLPPLQQYNFPPVPSPSLAPVIDPQTGVYYWPQLPSHLNEFGSVNRNFVSPSGLLSGDKVYPQPQPDMFNRFN